MFRRFLSRTAVMAALAAGMLIVAAPYHPARALDVVAAEMQPIDLRVAELEAGLKEIERRANMHSADLDRWIVWWTKIKDLANETGNELKKNFEERIANLELAQALLSSLEVTDSKQHRSMPHVGSHSAETMSLLLANTRVEAAKWAELIAEGSANWHIAAAGAVTGLMIQKRIDDLEAEILKIKDDVRTGAYAVNIAGYGAVKGKDMRAEIASLEERRSAIRQKMIAGEYAMTIPGLGVRTRNQIDAEIAALEADFARRRATVQRGELAILRPMNDWMTANKLREVLDADAKSYEVLKKLVSDGLYNVWIVNFDWAKGVDLEGRVKKIEDTIEDVRVAVADGEYRANVVAGWNASRKELEKYIGDLQVQQANPQVDAKGRAIIAAKIEAAQKSIGELQAISAYDLAILAVEKTKFSRYLASIMKLARPDFEHRELVRLQREEMLADIPIEAELWFKMAERQIARLRAARAWIPSGG